MTALLDIIHKLEASAESDRVTDAEIATLFNYQGSKAPYFTRSFDAAMLLATTVCPKEKSGFSWEDGMASAKVGRGPFCQSTTPPLALCLAALKTKAIQDGLL